MKRVRLLISTLVLISGLVGELGAQTRPTIPTSLTNAQFRDIFTTFSEPGGSFGSDNFTSNENTVGQLAAELIARNRTGGAYVGVGPEQNFTYIAALKPQIVFIVDIRRQAVMQHLMFKALFELSPSRPEFVSRLFSRVPVSQPGPDATIDEIWNAFLSGTPDSNLFNTNFIAIVRQLMSVRGLSLSSDDTISLRYVYGSFHRYGPNISYRPGQGGVVATFASLTATADTAGVKRSFLATNENFQVVRNLHMRNLIVPIVGDFGGTQALRMVGDYLRERNAVVNAFYTSNVEQYLFRPTDLWRQFYRNVGNMPTDSGSLFIRPSISGAGSMQVVMFSQPATGAVTPPPPRPPTRPTLSASQQVVQNPALGSITGVVTDSASGRALSSVLVTLLRTSYGVTTDTLGAFTLPNIDPGSYKMNVRRVGYAGDSSTSVTLAAGASLVQNFRIKPQVVILSGVVTTGVGARTELAREQVQLCPIVAFLAAHAAGRVNSYADATACAR